MTKVRVLNGGNVVDVVDVDNAFCPTGKGGGVDPTCGKGGNKKGKTAAKKSGTGIGGNTLSNLRLRNKYKDDAVVKKHTEEGNRLSEKADRFYNEGLDREAKVYEKLAEDEWKKADDRILEIAD